MIATLTWLWYFCKFLAVSVKNKGRFQQAICLIEQIYQGHWNEVMFVLCGEILRNLQDISQEITIL